MYTGHVTKKIILLMWKIFEVMSAVCVFGLDGLFYMIGTSLMKELKVN